MLYGITDKNYAFTAISLLPACLPGSRRIKGMGMCAVPVWYIFFSIPNSRTTIFSFPHLILPQKANGSSAV